MTRTFERFLRSLSDDDLVAFAEGRAAVRPPYWRTLELALRIERTRRGLAHDVRPAPQIQHTRRGLPLGAGRAQR